MWVGKIHALVAHRGHGRRGLRRYRQSTQAVRHKQNEVTLLLCVAGAACRKIALHAAEISALNRNDMADLPIFLVPR